ncbi:hypothetical protein [Agriterribacter sp.]|uniref:hypothetical protein n=1 Tax=Agriterribacter sp. TaxID=2821509 RepID=UPI002BFBD55E|nr:hypothetical protein [Agriterribacter sp.]HRO47569.1 hypothetical protein [Agriterribacter sp.]HRQ18786.1 hypothetical protein [Agriterribacter sp.]
MSKFAAEDIYGKAVVKEQWDKIVANGLVKGHLNQLFKAFPDAPIYQGFGWKLKERVEGELPLEMETTLKIKSVTTARGRGSFCGQGFSQSFTQSGSSSTAPA